MSADNGVYILVSRGRWTRHGYKREYRAVHAQAIENITYHPDYPDSPNKEPELNREMVLEYFGEARVFTDRRMAEGYAQAIYDQWMREFGVVEYGIRWFDECAHIPFPKWRSDGKPRRHRRTKLALAG